MTRLTRLSAVTTSLSTLTLAIGAPLLLVASAQASHHDHPLAVVGPWLVIIEIVAFLRAPLRFVERSTTHRDAGRLATAWRLGAMESILTWPYRTWSQRHVDDMIREQFLDTSRFIEAELRGTTPIVALLSSWFGALLLSVLLLSDTSARGALLILGVLSALWCGGALLLAPLFERIEERNNARQREWAAAQDADNDVALAWHLLGEASSSPSSVEPRPLGRLRVSLVSTSAAAALASALVLLMRHQRLSYVSAALVTLFIVTGTDVHAGLLRLLARRAQSHAEQHDALSPHLSEHISGDAETVTINGTTFGPGDRLAVTGASGSGKSTLLRTLAGLEETNTQEIAWHSVDGHRIEKPTNVAWVPSWPRYLEGSLADVIRSGREVAVDEDAIATLDLPYAATDEVRHASSGQAVRIAVLRALAAAPGILLLDEPTAPLDADARQRLLTLLERFPGVVVIATHDPQVVEWATHRLALP
jgi:ABC-type lipoprotein export system ATPase subunit